ncbi:hypothetical protein OAA06_00655 [bacterium]|nr:hypothetical protein [bacterium]
MKEKDLYVEFEPQKSVYYVEKEDDSYGPIVSGSQLSANYLDDFWEKKGKLEQSLRKQLINNEISPVFYYMTLQELGPKDLAGRMSMSYRRLKKLFDPKGFKKLSIGQAGTLADIFNIPVANLFQNFLLKDEDRDKLVIEQAMTENKLYHITKVSVK